MKIKLLVLVATFPLFAYSQNLQRKIINYETLKMDTASQCDEATKQKLELSFVAVQENNSKAAVSNARAVYNSNTSCPEIFEVYGYSLFRSGDWFEGLEIIEKGIEKFGRIPELIKRRSTMSLEMAELGTGQKSIDGNAVYKANALKYDEPQFKEENLRSALYDLEYLAKEYERTEERFYVAKIYQLLKEIEKSNSLLKPLVDDEEYGRVASFTLAENYISLGKPDDAETEMNRLLAASPRLGEVYDKLAEIYALRKDEGKVKEFKSKSIFYKNVPDFTNLAYSEENFELLKFFGTNEQKADKKLKKLDDVFKQNNTERTINICLIILKLHANHGNGVEDRATEILEKIGKPAIAKVNLLFQSDVSTCTITNLAYIMATVKDPDSWELLKTYLPHIANMPMTLTPPAVPEQMIRFNEEEGTREILKVVKPMLAETGTGSDPLADLRGFGEYVYFAPLEKINKTKLKKIATELNYSAKEFKQLEEKLK